MADCLDWNKTKEIEQRKKTLQRQNTSTFPERGLSTVCIKSKQMTSYSGSIIYEKRYRKLNNILLCTEKRKKYSLFDLFFLASGNKK